MNKKTPIWYAVSLEEIIRAFLGPDATTFCFIAKNSKGEMCLWSKSRFNEGDESKREEYNAEHLDDD